MQADDDLVILEWCGADHRGTRWSNAVLAREPLEYWSAKDGALRAS